MAALLGDRWIIDEVGDGFDAVEACASASYDLILMDVAMPRMSGVAAAREIRSRPGLPPRIIGVSAIAPYLARDDAGAFDAVLDKPISVLRFAEILDAVLGGRALIFGDQGPSSDAAEAVA